MNDLNYKLSSIGSNDLLFDYMDVKAYIKNTVTLKLLKRTDTILIEGSLFIEDLNQDILENFSVYTVDTKYSTPEKRLTVYSLEEDRPFFMHLTLLENNSYSVDYLLSNKDTLEDLKKDFNILPMESYNKNKQFIDWSLQVDSYGDILKQRVPLEVTTELEDILYPNITEQFQSTVSDFIRAFKQSSESVLILTGIKGTGKTELIRHISKEFDSNVSLTFNKQVMTENIFYYNFFSDKESDLLVIEDADNLLEKRSDGNPIMDLFLNLSDGLISNKNKKFIFTTNLPSTSYIDDALLRKGRCFAVIDFQYYTKNQLENVLNHYSIDMDDFSNRLGLVNITLADVMAYLNKTYLSKEDKKESSFGFVK